MLKPIAAQQVRVSPALRETAATPLLELLATDLPLDKVTPGTDLLATLFWRRRADVGAGVSMQIQLVDEAGSVYSEVAREPVMFMYPVRLWRDNELVADTIALPVPANTPRGKYRLLIRAIDTESQELVPFRNPHGEATSELDTPFFAIP
jgi:hypothetical protein